MRLAAISLCCRNNDGYLPIQPERMVTSKYKIISFSILGIILALMFYYSRNQIKSFYTAAVVDYRPISPFNFDNSEDYMLANAKEYGKIMEEAKKSDVDIIAFAEYGLTDAIRPKSMPIDSFAIEIPEPCDQSSSFPYHSKVLNHLAAAAKSSNLYAVISLPEKVNCTSINNCPPAGYFLFNTLIAINRKGHIVARYRKFNLFGEGTLAKEKEVAMGTFKTDFGVEFGMIICFDILFENPAIRLVSEKKVSNVILSVGWMSELPFLPATAVQAGWAHSMGVNLLSSCYNNPLIGSGGSGVFNGKNGAITMTMNDGHMTKLLIAKVPIKNSERYENKDVGEEDSECSKKEASTESFIIRNFSETIDPPPAFYTSEELGAFRYKVDRNIINMTSELLKPKENYIPYSSSYTTLDYVNDEFNASIKVRWHVSGHYSSYEPRYRLFSYSGKKIFIDYEDISLAGLVACRDAEALSCGFVPHFSNSSIKTTIESIEITARSRVLTLGYLPVTVDSKLKQLPPSYFKFSKKLIYVSGVPLYEIKMSLLKPVTDIFTFAVYKIITYR